MRRVWIGWVLAAWVLASASACTERQAPVDHPDATFFDAAVDAHADGSAAACRSDAECADRFACTVDHCNAGACDHVPCTDCCGPGRSCDPMAGCGPTPQTCTVDADCMDAQPCTLDACRNHVCQHQPMDALCPSGQICLGQIGCTPRPPDHCTTDADCMAIGFCYGTWMCAGEVGCAFVAPTSCDDTDACTADRCDAVANACAHDGRDADMDHHVDGTCTGGDDCDDTSATTHPGATEACNGHDDDCDSITDEGCCAAGPCTTSCGTTGMTSCNPDGTVGPCMPPIETCNGADDDCDTTADEGFDCVRGAATACGTSCGSTGSSVCDSTCHAGACVPPVETCNGMDDDCTGGPDNGLGCVLGTSMPCLTGCSSMGTQTCIAGCTWGTCIPPAETCNGVDDNCNGARDDGVGTCYLGETRSCQLLVPSYASGTALCRGDCSSFDPSTCSNCGNSVIDSGEMCDGPALGGATCASRGYVSGTLRCASGCVFDETGCTHCGDNTIQSPEQCDGTALGGATCASLGTGYTGGNLRCTSAGAGACTYDTSMCARCGNGLVETGEQCDGSVGPGVTCYSLIHGYTGTVSCGAGCTYNTSMCVWNPTDTWLVSPAATEYCAFGTVNISLGSLAFVDNGTTLSVQANGAQQINCTMTGPSARTTRTINVTCSVAGACTETYTLTGTFTGDNTWTGSFRAQFTGGSANCFDCATRTISGLTGSR